MNRYRARAIHGSITRMLVAAGLATALATPLWAGAAVDPEAALQAEWRDNLQSIETPDAGCFEATYPNLFWERVDCVTDAPLIHSQPREGAPGEVTGNGHDYVAKAKGLITFSGGSFVTKGVSTEKSVGVPLFHNEGILGPNEYSLQINTNANDTTGVCDKHKDCTVWQQYVYSTDYFGKGKAAVFIEYWLLNWGDSACPKTWVQVKPHCVKNSALTAAPDLPISDLGKLDFTGTAKAGGHDSAMLALGNKAWTLTAKDSVLDVSSVWHESEFNVFGDAGGSRADFNSGSKITVTLVLLDGSTAAPSCVKNAGTTGETNNLNLGSCKASGGIPNIVFGESN